MAMTHLRGGLIALALAGLAWPAAAQPVPRAADGHPDLSGVWSNASNTWLTRAPGSKLVVTAEEAGRLEAANPLNRRRAEDAKPSKVVNMAPGQGDPGGYNAFWLDPGAKLAVVKGEHRTSWMVDPPDGQLPLSEAGRKRIAAHRARHDSDRAPSDPEALEPWDRCLIGSRGSGGPGMLNNIYNSNYQIVQTPQAVAIVVEMIHDTRSAPIFPDKATAQAHHGPAALHLWLGDSVGWWEGGTLVVETVNVNPEQGEAGPIFLSPQARVTERFTRRPEGVFYAFEVDDPAYYSRPWRAEETLTPNKGELFEYACHEGNYALRDILAGARHEEAGGGPSGR
jgi:hypothetical protein